jgi:murein L,D-transpeptidase YcbB/YkuD
MSGIGQLHSSTGQWLVNDPQSVSNCVQSNAYRRRSLPGGLGQRDVLANEY